MPFQLQRKEILFEGRAFQIVRQHLTAPDGRHVQFDLVQHIGAVTILPVDEHGRILFVRQYRVGTNSELLELPAGTLNPGEDPRVCAEREVREETGKAAAEVRKLGECFMVPGYSTEYMHIYLATGLRDDPLQGDEDEFLELEAIPAGEAYRMARAGEIRDAKTLAALFLAEPYVWKT